MVSMQKQRVQIIYPYPGARSPVFLAGSFTDPPWQPRQLRCEETEAGEFQFSESFDIAAGEWQYKFCLGLNSPGERWLCDNKTRTSK